ncbi:pancreatic secretory granule membrane major glycoprotein GP2-like [Xenopus tropicalis]|uniref:Pancreatic secretory granule membrane major glycoprotein GP2-like n=1 Tax=Xenopus tropicalis TaxID=8364 RepID=A0A8J1IVS0_XENTR|nr:pancreatic secretory granule membrane major glycoprotein GP2-like [Xenopus tropicalis]
MIDRGAGNTGSTLLIVIEIPLPSCTFLPWCERLDSIDSTNKTHAFYTISFEFHIELGLIIRDKLITTATCIYPLDMRLSLETAVKPIISTTIIDVSGTGELKAHMAVFNSSDYLYPYQGSEIELYTHTVIYIGVFLEGPDPSQYAMVLKDCYATPSNDPNDPIKYYIIQNRCPNRYDGTVEVQANGVDIAAKFSFEVFAFVGDYDRVYMHCDIYACIKSLDTCEPKCKTRAMDETTEDTARITIGPFVRQAPTTKPKATEKAPTTKPKATEKAPTTKPKATEKAPTTKPKATEKAPTTKPKATEKAPSTKPKATEKAPTTKPKATEKAPTTKPKATEKAPTTKPKATEKAPTTKPKATEKVQRTINTKHIIYN